MLIKKSDMLALAEYQRTLWKSPKLTTLFFHVGTVYLYKIDTLYNIFLTVHGTSTENSPRPFDEIMAFLKAEE